MVFVVDYMPYLVAAIPVVAITYMAAMHHRLTLLCYGLKAISWLSDRVSNRVRNGIVTIEVTLQSASVPAAAESIIDVDLTTLALDYRTNLTSQPAIYVIAKHLNCTVKDIVSIRYTLNHDTVTHVVYADIEFSASLSYFESVVGSMLDDTLLTNQTLPCMPTSARLVWNDQSSKYNVMDTVVKMIGPKSRWWQHGVISDYYGVTGESLILESLRDIYGTRITRRLANHLHGCTIILHFHNVLEPLIITMDTGVILPPHLRSLLPKPCTFWDRCFRPGFNPCAPYSYDDDDDVQTILAAERLAPTNG